MHQNRTVSFAGGRGRSLCRDPPAAEALVERAQRPGCLSHAPRGLDQRPPARNAGPAFGDPTWTACRCLADWSDLRVQAEVGPPACGLVRNREASADRGHERRGADQVHARPPSSTAGSPASPALWPAISRSTAAISVSLNAIWRRPASTDSRSSTAARGSANHRRPADAKQVSERRPFLQPALRARLSISFLFCRSCVFAISCSRRARRRTQDPAALIGHPDRVELAPPQQARRASASRACRSSRGAADAGVIRTDHDHPLHVRLGGAARLPNRNPSPPTPPDPWAADSPPVIPAHPVCSAPGPRSGSSRPRRSRPNTEIAVHIQADRQRPHHLVNATAFTSTRRWLNTRRERMPAGN